MMFKAGTPVYSYEIMREAGQYVMYINYLGAPHVPSLADSEIVEITVNGVNRPPVLEVIGSKNVGEGSNLSFRIHAADPDGDPVILSAVSVPLNATFVDSGNGAGSFIYFSRLICDCSIGLAKLTLKRGKSGSVLFGFSN